VLYRTSGQTAEAGECWVIELPDQSWAKIPLSWAVGVDDTTECAAEAIAPARGPWVDVAALLDLATMVRYVKEKRGEEGVGDEPYAPGDVTVESDPVWEDGCRRAALLGAIALGAATRTDPDPGGDVEQAAARSSEGQGGGA